MGDRVDRGNDRQIDVPASSPPITLSHHSALLDHRTMAVPPTVWAAMLSLRARGGAGGGLWSLA
jgi:hypothetical protein